MREIKFRVWDSKKKLMVYNIHELYDGYGDFRDSQEKTIDWYEDTSMVMEASSFGSLLLREDNTYPVMQFTGLHDANKKEIYEGDICKVETWVDNPYIYKVHPNLFEVTYMDDCDRAAFELYSPDELWGKKPDGSLRTDSSNIDVFLPLNDEQRIEVIGNIYENPELIPTL